MVKIFTMVKGEADIVEDWVLYHGYLFGFKNLFVIDNFSLDGTFQILLSLKQKYGIKVMRLSDYKKKGQYMTLLLRKFCINELAFPIDIDEFIVYYDKGRNQINCNRATILKYILSLPKFPIFKMNYINSKILKQNGYNRATVESTIGEYSDYGQHAKTFFNSVLFKGEIDHGNHYHTNNFVLTKLCLIHFHTRNLDQIKKKVYNNVKGLGHNPLNKDNLKSIVQNNPTTMGFHHINKQIDILENTFTINVESNNTNDISLEPFNNFMKKIR
jgi:hypothetical protein